MSPAKPRHRWVKLVIHKYICNKCGCGKENVQKSESYYETMYHMPTGVSKFMKSTPPCEIGPRTLVYLAKYASEIDAAAKPSRDKALEDPGVQAMLEAFPAEISDVEESESAEDGNY